MATYVYLWTWQILTGVLHLSKVNWGKTNFLTATVGKASCQDSFIKRLSVARCPILCVQRRSGLESFAGHIELQYYQEIHCKQLESGQSWSKQDTKVKHVSRGEQKPSKTRKSSNSNGIQWLQWLHTKAAKVHHGWHNTGPRSACSQQRQVQCSFTQRAASSKHQSMIPCWFQCLLWF